MTAREALLANLVDQGVREADDPPDAWFNDRGAIQLNGEIGSRLRSSSVAYSPFDGHGGRVWLIHTEKYAACFKRPFPNFRP